LRASSIDVAILALPVRGHEFEAVPLLTERLFAALPPKHKLAARRSLALKDLQAEPFLLLRDGHAFATRGKRLATARGCIRRLCFESGQFPAC